ncbi:MAG TPA: hypothetical protein VNH22_07595, partial [Blastocatellia bacterium]|nr:hypothetical protein [Blastocatellia bacterium]
MSSFRFAAVIMTGALAFGAAGCVNHETGGNTAPTNTAAANANSSAGGEQRSSAQVEREDGSTVSVATEPDGSKREERSFKSGEVTRVSRVTRPNGTRTATVEMRDGRRAELKDQNEVEKAL